MKNLITTLSILGLLFIFDANPCFAQPQTDLKIVLSVDPNATADDRVVYISEHNQTTIRALLDATHISATFNPPSDDCFVMLPAEFIRLANLASNQLRLSPDNIFMNEQRLALLRQIREFAVGYYGLWGEGEQFANARVNDVINTYYMRNFPELQSLSILLHKKKNEMANCLRLPPFMRWTCVPGSSLDRIEPDAWLYPNP